MPYPIFYQIDVNNPGFQMERISIPSDRSLGRTPTIELRATLADAVKGFWIVNVGTRDNLIKTPGNFLLKITGVGFEDGSYWSVGTNRSAADNGYSGKSASSNPVSQPLFSSVIGGGSRKENPEADEANQEVKDLVDQSSVTTPPKIQHNIQPEYTPEAQANETRGAVLLNVVFRSDGKVKVISGLPDGLTEQAIKAARGLQFEPAMKDGRAVSIRSNLEYQFAISESQGK